MATLTKKQFQETYGDPSMYGLDKKREESTFSSIKQMIAEQARGGIEKIGEGIEFQDTQPSLVESAERGLKVGAGAIETATAPLAPIFAPIGKGVEYVSEKISNIPAVQKFAKSKAGETTARVAEDVQNVSTIAGAVTGAKGAPRVAKSVSGGVEGGVARAGGAVDSMKAGAQKAVGGVKSAGADLVPTRANLINSAVKDALGFTKLDVANLKNNTGNMMGEWLAQNDLIGTNKANTLGLVNKFFTDNYALVRDEIGKVKTQYTPDQIPRVVEGLSFLREKLDGTLGLEKQVKEIDTLLKKEALSLDDIQRVKELIDEHTNIYKKSGDVGEGIQKQGLDNIRKEIRKFIEDEVQKNTGVDIQALNNNVSTARGIIEIDKVRDVGVLSKKLSLRDTLISAGLFAGVGPIAGVASFFLLKLSESPAALLRFSRWLDDLPKSEKKAVNDSILRGEVPKEAVEASGVELDKITKPQNN